MAPKADALPKQPAAPSTVAPSLGRTTQTAPPIVDPPEVTPAAFVVAVHDVQTLSLPGGKMVKVAVGTCPDWPIAGRVAFPCAGAKSGARFTVTVAPEA